MDEHRGTSPRRHEVEEVESILADEAIDFGDTAHVQPVGGDAVFTWEYTRSRPALTRLYEQATRRQWSADDLPWDTQVDVESVATEMSGPAAQLFEVLAQVDGSPLGRWGDREWNQFAVEALRFRLSQFLHGEQGALTCAAKIVETVPWIDAKYYAATQVMDEARHVEVFSRYVDTKLEGRYRVNPALQLLIDDIVADSRWDITYMGMQIMVEGLALAAFGFMHMITSEPLLKHLLRSVLADEARHVAFGVVSLSEVYAQLSEREIRERQEFAFEAAIRMRDRIMLNAVWERMGIDRATIGRMMIEVHRPGANPFESALFSKIVPSCKRLGLLDAGDGWLRDRFTEIGVIEHEDLLDADIESAILDAVGEPPQDR